MSETESPRTYNRRHRPRKYLKGRRRISVYISWSYPAEANRNPAELDNRYSTMTEVRRAMWSAYETPRFADPRSFQQSIDGSLELFFSAWERFQAVVGEATEQVVPVFQRVDQAGFPLPLEERVVNDADTLLVFGLDHAVTEQEASQAEVEGVREFLRREGSCLIVGPHHDVGASPDAEQRAVEYAHHGDPLVPCQQRFGRYTRSLMKGLGIPVENRFGLRPAVGSGNRIAPLKVCRDLDTRGWLAGVTAFNFHMHLPHDAVTADDTRAVRVLAQQPIDLSRPHPLTAAGNKEFNALVWVPPAGVRPGDVLVADSTLFSTLFGVDKSLERFWRNIATAA
jgi:hypothetical protein